MARSGDWRRYTSSIKLRSTIFGTNFRKSKPRIEMGSLGGMPQSVYLGRLELRCCGARRRRVFSHWRR
ncbi:hypothetical protein ERO13_D12G222866v2 [Gossypium hirsutum]|uniref:Uncharacterized protein n=1 Tax=Gossypium tomentosum TaxID=34277 RepID=A0A5D2IDJ0_GOSTO|nr:hypothetical protein ERO13_D12G222866v2 [Gossypium hirsutum]TYH40661.1 hypothetical protein ES332_D12G262600v1 [Gossypium tomentosum]